MAIQSMGVGSGLDIASLVSQLVAAEGTPKKKRLDTKEADTQARISAMGTLKGALTDFQTAFASLKSVTAFSTAKVSTSNKELFTATATNSAVNGSHSIEVLAIAKAQQLTTTAANAVANLTTVVGTGDLTFTFDSNGDGLFDGTDTSKTVTVTDGTLVGIRDAINTAGIGVSASIVNNGTGYQLSLTSETGLKKNMSISVAETGGSGVNDGNNTNNTGLSILHYDPAGAMNLTQVTAGQDAQVRIDGVTVTNSTNTITSAISGVTLSLVKDAVGTVGTVTVSRDGSAVSALVSKFVDAYNSLQKQITSLTYYNVDNGDHGTFIGDSMLRTLKSQVRSVLGAMASNESVKYNALSTVGITTNSDGTLKLDSAKLSTALSSELGQVQRLFAGGIKDLSTTDQAALEFVYIPEGLPAGTVGIDITQQATRATYTSGAFNAAVFPGFTPGAGHSFDIAVDGGTAVSVTLAGTYASDTDLATAMTTAINNALAGANQNSSVTVTSSGGSFVINSTTYGSASGIALSNVGANAASDFGFAATTVAGVDVAGTIGGLSATGVGQVLSGSGNYSGLQIKYFGNSATYTTSAQSVDGVFDKLNSIVDKYLASNGSFKARSDKYQKEIDDIELQRTKLAERLSALERQYVKQFSAMDALVAQLNNVGSFLTNQLKSLPGANK